MPWQLASSTVASVELLFPVVSALSVAPRAEAQDFVDALVNAETILALKFGAERLASVSMKYGQIWNAL